MRFHDYGLDNECMIALGRLRNSGDEEAIAKQDEPAHVIASFICDVSDGLNSSPLALRILAEAVAMRLERSV